MSKPVEPLREVIARHGLSASKALGQNFILDRQLLARVASIPGALEGERVYEVGPGPGGLTRALLEAGASVVAVERDRRCIPALAELQHGFEGRLEVIEADALEIDEPAVVGENAHVVANLPYNVGTALLLKWLGGDWPPWWRSLTLMFQKEVAERLVAQAGSDAFGRLSVAAQWRSRPRIAMVLNRSAFVPPPKVTSAVVHIVPTEQPDGVSPAVLARLTAAAFGQRRKMLRSSLKKMPAALEAAAMLGIDTERRAETLSISEWIALARALSAEFDLGLSGTLAAATVGPRLIAAESWATCGQALALQIVCSFWRFACARAVAPISTIASPWTAIASGSFGSRSKALLVIRIDCERGLEEVFRGLELAGGNLLLGLPLKLDRLGRDLIVRPLARNRRRQSNSSQTDQQKARQGLHQFLHVSPSTSTDDRAARRKSRRFGRGPVSRACQRHPNAPRQWPFAH